MRAHVIENGIVVNTIVVESLDFMPGLVDADAVGGAIGWQFKDGVMICPEQDSEVIAKRTEDAATAARVERDQRINDIQWRVERWQREERLGLAHTDDIAVLDKYIQALADVPSQPGFPFNVVWPEIPA